MLKNWTWVAVFFCAVALSAGLLTAAGAAAGDLVVGVRGFSGLAGGSTDDPNKTGKIGFSAGGGVGVQYYFLKLGKMDLGLGSGMDYVYIQYNSTTIIDLTGFGGPVVNLQSNTNYSYITVPLTVRGLVKLNDKLALTADAGGFMGFFLGGQSDNIYTPEYGPFGLVNGVSDLDDSTTEATDIGLRLAVGLDVDVSSKLKLTPGILFDLGLKDTSKDTPPVSPSKDTFWKLTALVTFVYEVF